MDKNKEMSRAIDFKKDLKYSLENNEKPIITERDIETLNWLIEQAKRAEMYKNVLMDIGAKYKPPSSYYANSVLIEADQRFNKF